MEPVSVLHYHEIALKGRNRDQFERQLIENIRWALRDVVGAKVQRMSGRIAVRCDSLQLAAVGLRLSRVFGIANVLTGFDVRQNREGLREDAVKVVERCMGSSGRLGGVQRDEMRSSGASTEGGVDGLRRPRSAAKNEPEGSVAREAGFAGSQGAPTDRTLQAPQTFSVRVKRGNKSYPATSQELEREIGAAIVEATGLHVDLEHPDLTVAVEIVEDTAFVLLEREEGPGGLPVGVSGRVLALLSSGFDSPVAAWRMMKRGCVADFVHFHSYPYTSDASMRNVEEIVRTLNGWQQNRGRLHLVPLIEYQKQVMTAAPSALRVLLYRRMMVRVAEAIARAPRGAGSGSAGLVTGESIGQVASQTIPNMAAVESVVALPIFRPLLGYDKLEIIRQAEGIGTAAISIRPYDDCCSLFTPAHPATHATIAELDAAEASLGAGEWVDRLVESATVQRV